MQLIIKNSSGSDLSKFCNWLVSQMRTELSDRIDIDKLAVRDEALSKNVKSKDGRKITAYEIVVTAINNLGWKKHGKVDYIIRVNDKIKLEGTDNTVNELVKYIEYGTFGMQPLYFIRKEFDEAAFNLADYFQYFNTLIG